MKLDLSEGSNLNFLLKWYAVYYEKPKVGCCGAIINACCKGWMCLK